MNKRIFILTSLIATFILVALIYIQSFNNKLQTFDNTDKANRDVLVPQGWQEYKNDYVGINIYHPKEYTFENISKFSFLLLDQSEQTPVGNTNFLYFSYVPMYKEWGPRDSYNVVTNQLEQMLRLDIGDSANVSGEQEFETWYTYTRNGDIAIGGKNFRVFENNSPWEFPSGTTELRFINLEDESLYQLGAYVSDDGNFTKKNAMEIINTVTFTKPMSGSPRKEMQQVTAPTNWKTYSDRKLTISINYPSNFEVTPAPPEGSGGFLRLQGEKNNEFVIIEVGEHSDLKKPTNMSLREFEISRSPGTKFDEERMINLNGLDIYQQLVPIISGGGPNRKDYGIYNIFIINQRIYFLELYTHNPFDQFEFVNELISTIIS